MGPLDPTVLRSGVADLWLRGMTPGRSMLVPVLSPRPTPGPLHKGLASPVLPVPLVPLRKRPHFPLRFSRIKISFPLTLLGERTRLLQQGG